MREHEVIPVLLLLTCGVALADPLPTSSADFYEPGTQPRQTDPPQPWMTSDFLLSASTCDLCHRAGEGATTLKPFRWRGSMHAHSFRDPVFQAAFVIANQDAPGSGELCIRCHAPRAWIEGRATPPTGNPNGSTLFYSDRDEGVTCHVCHRLVDPVYNPGVSPSQDQVILDALLVNGYLPHEFGNAQMVVDPMDVRRGPFNTPAAPHPWLRSPFHRESDLCGTCHDVSAPHLSRAGGPAPSTGDPYVFNTAGEPHPTGLKADMFPEQRTYTEWSLSAFATTPGGVFIPDDVNPSVNRFGGNRTMVSQCQDCHMPAATARACSSGAAPIRSDQPYHSFAAANTWVPDVLIHLYGPNGTKEFDAFTVAVLQRGKADSTTMLTKATDLALSQFAGELTARVVNQTGHKLLTGMPEGRRIWLNVQFFAGPDLIAEHGAYDFDTAVLSAGGTKVYETVFGISEDVAARTGRPTGPTFNLMLASVILKDNRIPPRGFNRAAFDAAQAGHVGYHYADGHYWDDTRYCIPPGATRARVRLYYQVSSREYIEFLRDENTTDSRGETLYQAWLATAKSPPVVMDDVSITLSAFVAGDVTGDGRTTFADITAVLANFGCGADGSFPPCSLARGDANCDGRVDFRDLTSVLANWSAG